MAAGIFLCAWLSPAFGRAIRLAGLAIGPCGANTRGPFLSVCAMTVGFAENSVRSGKDVSGAPMGAEFQRG